LKAGGAACALALDSVPVIVRQIDNPLEAERILIESNRQRDKTASEVMREAEHIGRIEAAYAKDRSRASAEQTNAKRRGDTTVVANLPQPSSSQKGKTRDKVAEQIGMKRTTYRKVKNVHDTAHDEAAPAPIRAVAQQQMAALNAGETTAHAADKAGRPLTFRQFIEAPYPVGVGSTLEQIKKIVALQSRRELLPEVAASLTAMRETLARLVKAPLPAHGEVGGGHGRDDNVMSDPPEQQGNSREYTVRRLKRDRPDLAEMVIGGAPLTPPDLSH